MTPQHRPSLGAAAPPADTPDSLFRGALSPARAFALAQLDRHSPADAKEAADITRMQSLIRAHPNIFSSACQIGHITASAVIIEPQSRRTLLHYHNSLGRWLQVGGHPERETDMAQAALREAREETGLPDLAHYPPGDSPTPIDFDVHAIPERGAMPEHLHLDFRYVLTANQPAALAPEAGESTRFRWLSFGDALAMHDQLDEALIRLLRKAFAVFPVSAEL